MLTKGGFTRDEWNHLLHLLNIMNFSMFSCSLFLSNRKQSTMSKIIQGRKTGEEPAVAKPRSTCLISRNLFNQKYTSSLVSDASDVPGDPQLDSESVFGSTGKLARNKDQNPATCSQERKKDIPGEGTCGKLQRGFENQLDRTRIDNHNVQISDYRYVDSLWERETEIESSSGQSNVGIKKSTYWSGSDVDNDEVSSSCRASIPRELGCIQEYQLRGAQDVVRKNVETDRGTIIRDPECIDDDFHVLALDENYFVSWSRHQMGES